MFWLFTLGQQGVAALAYHRTERMCSCCNCRRSLPGADASTIDECGERVPVMARTLEIFFGDVLGVPHYQRGIIDVFALLLVQRLVK